MKILLLDIETSPNVAHVWGLWRQNVGLPQLIESGYVMCWAAKWLGDKDVIFSSIYHHGPKTMLKHIHSLMDEADAIVHYNGSKFDIPTLNKEFLLYNMPPPSPAKQIDLLKTAKSQFRFISNKLDYVAKFLGIGKKLEHIGHELWIRCMNNDPSAWKQMKEYNIHDVVLLEDVYNRLIPWIKGHANHSLYEDLVCPQCGSRHYHKEGFKYTSTCKYQQYQCNSCGGWFRGTTNIGLKAGNKFVSVN